MQGLDLELYSPKYELHRIQLPEKKDVCSLMTEQLVRLSYFHFRLFRFESVEEECLVQLLGM